MSLERKIEAGKTRITVNNYYDATAIWVTSVADPFAPMASFRLPHDKVTEFVAALLEVQEDSHAHDRNRNND